MSLAPRLIVVNHVLDDSDPYLSHQGQVVRMLAEHFSQITVITGRVGSYSIPKNVSVIDTNWIPGHKIRNLLRFIWLAFPEISSRRTQIIFSHMADLQASLISPVARLAGKRHVFWYAHSHKSIFLTFASFFVNRIVTSTPGSCPIKGNHVSYIGQSVNPQQFAPRSEATDTNFRFIHIGRLDRSKNIDLIIQSVLTIKGEYSQASLTLIGSSANSESIDYLEEMRERFSPEIRSGVVTFVPSVLRADLCDELWSHDYFIHAYMGSLDKTLIEATLTRTPVISLNLEYSKIFGTWSKLESPTLVEEFLALHAMPKDKVIEELKRRGDIAEDLHSTERWIDKLSAILISN